MKKVLILANNDIGLYKFRKELIQELVKKYEVFISLPYGDLVPVLEKIGCTFINTPINRRGTNPITDIKLLLKYNMIIRTIKPDVVLSYTIKPNVFGGIACQGAKTPYIANITGLGTSLENEGLMQKAILFLYKFGLKKASCVFFQNKQNRQFFIEKNILNGKSRLIPGSGVNLIDHCIEEYPDSSNCIKFLFIGRIMQAKGIDEFLEMAQRVREKYPNTEFSLLGTCEENYTERISDLVNKKIINYFGQQEDIQSFIRDVHATILPSYHEGTANVLLESASSGRPVLTSRVNGCIETFDESESGFGFEVRNVDSLVETVIKFINLPHKEKMAIGLAGRRKMEREFDRNLVINAYLEEINSLIS